MTITPAPTLTTLVTFNGSNGRYPAAVLTADAAGNLYGTTIRGGADDGTVFELAAGTHALTTLTIFGNGNGAEPDGRLIADSAGNLYGTTVNGGTDNNGTVFELAAGSRTLTTLFTFDGSDGAHADTGVVLDTAGNLYGTTIQGGTNDSGTVFELAAGTRAHIILASLGYRANPGAGLTIDGAGNLFGTTSGGGVGMGMVFEVAAGTGAFSTLAYFYGPNGAYPVTGLTADVAGNLYGTTQLGGMGGNGTVYELAAGSHALRTIANFDGSNGANPDGNVIFDTAGNLFGTTYQQGPNGHGTVYELAAGTRALTTLVSFTGINGADPYGGLTADAAGNLYGTTTGGGANGDGTVFEITNSGFVATPPPVVQAPGQHTVTATGSGVTINSFTDYGTILAGSGHATVNGGNYNLTVRLGGSSNTVTTTGGNDVISGGTGNDTLTLGGPTNGVWESGTGNVITTAAGAVQITAGSGGDTVNLGGGTAKLVFAGSGNIAFLNGSSATITDRSTGLALNVAAGGTDVITGFAAARGSVVNLLHGNGGYASSAAVVSALASDGHGGTMLALGGGGSIDFAGIALGSLHAANFTVAVPVP